ncbi:MAG: leucyl aminopeptidase family protein [Pseudomonadota bacterium]
MTEIVLPADQTSGDVILVRAVPLDGCGAALAELPDAHAAFARALDFTGKAGQCAVLPGEDGRVALCLFGLGEGADPFLYGKLPGLLPPGTYRFDPAPTDPELAALAFALGTYRFERYLKPHAPKHFLVCPEGIDHDRLTRTIEGVFLARDLINTPANDMGPDELEQAARTLATIHNGTLDVTTGDWLLQKNLPLIHAVGRASDRAPRLIDLIWGAPDNPKLTLVGKGVVFDTGGLDLKPSSNMRLMKKDMGGAANVLGLASMIMAAGLKVRLRVLVPVAENAVSGASFRPGDVLSSRKGLTVEIGNTDAEGRLILADALTLADEEEPDLIIDMATLTGAARVALGLEVVPFFTSDDELAAAFHEAGMSEADPVWRLPLWQPYHTLIKSKIADIDNAGKGGYGGAITAALFLSRFVEQAGAWAHFDMMAYNTSARPGRPEGGEAQAIRAVFSALEKRYGC